MVHGTNHSSRGMNRIVVRNGGRMVHGTNHSSRGTNRKSKDQDGAFNLDHRHALNWYCSLSQLHVLQ
jgi:hypothetical protein